MVEDIFNCGEKVIKRKMQSPERIHINLNAADGWELFEEHDVPDSHLETPSTEQIGSALAAAHQAGELFNLLGWIEDPRNEVNLRIKDSQDNSFTVSNGYQPPFEGTYTIADEPPPVVTSHGDYRFDLVCLAEAS